MARATVSRPAPDSGAAPARVLALAATLPPPLHARSDAPVPEHVRAALDRRARNLIEHDPGTRSGSDPEDLHQMRVSVRRMRAVLKAGRSLLDEAQSEPLRAELGWLGRALGPVRDLDVLREHLRAEAEALPLAQDGAAAVLLLKGFDDEYDQARRTLLSTLDSDRYLALVTSLIETISSPLPTPKSEVDGQETLHALVNRQFRKLRREIRRMPPDPPDDDLHAARIRGKRLRYTAELAAPSAGKPTRRLVKAAARFQDVLGTHQDACVAATRVRALLGPTTSPEVGLVAGQLVERDNARREWARQRWPEAWEKLRARARAI